MEALLVFVEFSLAILLCFVAIHWYFRRKPTPISVCKEPQAAYDYIIVGSGSSGSVVACRLAEDHSVTVLVLEAGDLDTKYEDVIVPRNSLALWDHPEADWGYLTTPQKSSCLLYKQNQFHYARGRMLGGCSSMNSLAYVRGNRDDYDSWARNGCDGWSYDDVLPYFKKSETTTDDELLQSGFHGGDGPLYVSARDVDDCAISQTFAAGMEELGYGTNCINGDKQLGYMFMQENIKDGERWSCVDAYLKPAVLKGNVDVVTNARVTKIEIEDGKATGVKYVDGTDTSCFVRAKKEVILSAGAFASPQILMLSGIGHREHLEELGIPVVADLPVGDNLVDHVGIFGPDFLLDKPITSTVAKPNSTMEKMAYKLFRRGRYASTGVQGMGFVKGGTGNMYKGRETGNPDLQFVLLDSLMGNDPDFGELMEKSMNISSGTLTDYFADRAGRHGVSLLSCLLKPKSRGTVRLRSSDPLDLPLIDPKWLEEDRDVDVLVKGLQEITELADTEALAEFGLSILKSKPAVCSNLEWGSTEYWEKYIRNITFHLCHVVGTCKMGPEDDPTTVVDSELRVHGIEGLRVVDASIMPDSLCANTHATCVMIGEKAADLIKGAYFS
ncbi:glucose dehydrogenase [FAD, quinone]-like [Lineus longissimus]|uniref:glucose dehydrogenase [FAD, quinone]-like n=1 Tax=Lineus longissimus TaxID=88925 RepID=UPI002B4E99D9